MEETTGILACPFTGKSHLALPLIKDCVSIHHGTRSLLIGWTDHQLLIFDPSSVLSTPPSYTQRNNNIPTENWTYETFEVFAKIRKGCVLKALSSLDSGEDLLLVTTGSGHLQLYHWTLTSLVPEPYLTPVRLI